ncbi:MAG TPA: M28 family peptidase [Gemmatimonadaceae bacterium]|nr:M28 family peptidase [Gemmatimonadaceae bacterium]
MKRLVLAAAALVLVALAPRIAPTQEREDRTLLTWDQMRAIINEASGERAQHHILELVPYPRVRALTEYSKGPFRESEVMARFAREYGYSNVEIVTYPQPNQLWQPTSGQLWLMDGAPRKLFDIYDTPVALGGNTPTHDVTAEVVDVGIGGRAEDYAGKDVRGKVVLGSAGMGVLQTQGVCQRGAVGVLSYNSMRPVDQPDIMISSSISAAPANCAGPGFGWEITARVGRDLAVKLGRGEKVTVRSVVEAQTFPGRLELVHATIPGDGSTDQTVFVSAHLYEGYIKQGANDDNSGCALTLEMGRTYLALIKAGALPKPKRTIHFLWVPEISGTNAYLNANPELEKHAIADLNFDMEGIRLSTSASYWVLHRTPDTFPTFLNDVAQSFMEFVSELNRERVRYRANGYAPTLPMYSQNGSKDPFYIKVDKHYGASDHVTYMQHGIPSVMYITWPDQWYHSSQDTPDKLDPTQFRRAAVVGAGAMVALATAGDEMALRVADEALGRGAQRMGDNQRKGLSYLGDVKSGAELADAYKEAKVAVRHQANVEKAVIKTVRVLFANPDSGAKRLGAFEPLVTARETALQNEVTAAFRMAALTWKVPATEPQPTDLERQAARLLVERVPAAAGAGGRGGGGGGGRGAGGGRGGIASRIPQHLGAELNILLGQRKTALEIRDFLSGEFEPLPLQDLMDYLRAQESAGAIKLVEQPEAKKGK